MPSKKFNRKKMKKVILAYLKQYVGGDNTIQEIASACEYPYKAVNEITDELQSENMITKDGEFCIYRPRFLPTSITEYPDDEKETKVEFGVPSEETSDIQTFTCGIGCGKKFITEAQRKRHELYCKKKQEKPKDERLDEIIKSLQEGYTPKEIAAKYGRTAPYVYNYLSRRGHKSSDYYKQDNKKVLERYKREEKLKEEVKPMEKEETSTVLQRTQGVDSLFVLYVGSIDKTKEFRASIDEAQADAIISSVVNPEVENE